MATVFASSDDVETRLPDGIVVAGIEVLSEIERGGMAVVYRGQRVQDGHPVALKVGTAEAAARYQAEERFQNEARLGDALRHPNIVRPLRAGRLSGPGEFAGRMFLVTELVEGRTLSWLMLYNQQGMPLERALCLATQVAEAMVAMHEQGIVHRDLTPANIIVDDDDRVHVIDFGLAYALGEGDVERSPDLTMDGGTVGTPLYMSPQQAMHLEPSGAFDVYAFGVLLYELLSGAAPNCGLPPEEVVAVRCNPKSKLFPLRRVAPDAPPEVAWLVERCLAYDASERPTAVEIVACLKGEATRGPSIRVPTEPTRLMRRPSVVAEGARPVGDETMVRLVQDDVQLPAVQRARARALEAESAGRDDEPREARLIPLVHFDEDAGDTGGGGAVADSSAEDPVQEEPTHKEPVQEELVHEGPGHVDAVQDERRGKLAFVVLVVVLFFVSVAAVAWWPGAPRSQASRGASSVAEHAIDSGSDVEPGEALEPQRPEVKAASAAELPDPEAAPEPETPEASVDPEPKLVPDVPRSRTKTKPRKPAGSGKKPAVTEPRDTKPGPLTSCAADRVDAREASKSKRWKAVLAATEDASCWSSGVERTRLRANALKNLGRYKACMRETAGQEAADLAQIHAECFRRASEE